MGKKYTYDDLASEGWSDERIRNWNGWDRSEPGTGYVQNRAPEGSGAVDAWTPPSWWNEEENGQWTGSQATAYHAWTSVLGRDPGVQGINLLAGMSYEDATRSLSLTPEARARGVDPTAFGNEVMAAEDVPEDLKPYYDEWARINGDEPFYSGHEQLLRWQKDMGSVEVYQGINDGTIQQLGPQAYQVTQAAVDKYGAENLKFTGYNRNAIIMVPKGSGVQVGRKKHGTSTARLFEAEAKEGETPWTQQYVDEGYDVYLATGSTHQGFMDRIQNEMVENLGMSEDVAATLMFVGSGGNTGGDFIHDVLKIDEGYFMTDPGGFVSGWFYGDEGNRHNVEGAMSFTGGDKDDPDDWKKTQRLQGYGSAAFTTALSMTGWGAGIAAALTAARNMGAAQTGRQDWDTAVGNAAVSLIASRLQGANGLQGGWQAASNAAIQAGSSAAQAYLTNEDSHTVDKQNIGAAAAVGAAGSLAGSFANAAGTQMDFGQTAQAFLNASFASAASYGGAAILAGVNGTELSGDAAFNALLAGVQGASTGWDVGKRNQARGDGDKPGFWASLGAPDAGIGARENGDKINLPLFLLTGAKSYGPAKGTPRYDEAVAARRQTRLERAKNPSAPSRLLPTQWPLLGGAFREAKEDLSWAGAQVGEALKGDWDFTK